MSKQMDKNTIKQKVSKVREVVKKQVSTNDIILTLHSFDYDVEKTIQSFCEGAASVVLDGWTNTGGNKKKNNKKKTVSTASVSTPAQTPAPSANIVHTPAVVPSSQTNGTAAVTKKATVSIPNGAQNGTQPTVVPVTSQASGNAKEQIQLAFKAIRAAVTEREKCLIGSLQTNSSFNGDISQIISLLSKFGSVTDGVRSSPPAKEVMRHATSQSSLTSSVGADSGVNLSPTHNNNVVKETKKTPVESTKTTLSSGGLELASDGLSAEAMAAIQASMQAQLAARGIDASVLSSLSNNSAPSRKSRKPDEHNKGKNGTGQKGKQQVTAPKLSIL